jgi:hypothetical protein
MSVIALGSAHSVHSAIEKTSPFERLSIVGGWTIFRSPNSRWADSQFTWPFGRLDLEDEQIVLSVRGPLGKLFAALSPLGKVAIPVVIPIHTVRQVEVLGRRSWFNFRAIRIHCQDPKVDGVQFGAFPSGFNALVDRLGALGLPLTEG